jgi:hypothetical protein
LKNDGSKVQDMAFVDEGILEWKHYKLQYQKGFGIFTTIVSRAFDEERIRIY